MKIKANIVNFSLAISGLIFIHACSGINKNVENVYTNTKEAATVIDIDGNVYHTITIGAQVWMVENLRTTRFNDGNSIPLVTDNSEWGDLNSPGYCWHYNNADAFKNTFGALYNWHTVNTGKLAPSGWHIPTDMEFLTLTNYLGDESIVGGKMKESGTSHWKGPNEGGNNSSGFTALPGGHRNQNGNFSSLTNTANFWSSSQFDSALAWNMNLYYNYKNIINYVFDKKYGFSVRCIKDN